MANEISKIKLPNNEEYILVDDSAHERIKTEINNLRGSDATGTIREIANNELALRLIASSAKESLNTLEEIAQWIQDHPGDAAAMNSRIENHTHTASFTPAGSLTNLSFTGDNGTTGSSVSDTITVATSTHTHTFTPAGTVNVTYTPAVSQNTGTNSSTGEAAASTHTHSFTPNGAVSATWTPSTGQTTGTNKSTVTVASSDHTHSFVPAGTVSGGFSGSTTNTASSTASVEIKQMSTVGTLPALTMSVSSKCLTFGWSAGTLPTSSTVYAATVGHVHSFTPTGSLINLSFSATDSQNTGANAATATVATSDHGHTFTPQGTVSATWTPSESQVTASSTATVKFAGSNHTHSFNPSATVSAEFVGASLTTAASASSVAVAAANHTHSFKPAGTVKGDFVGSSSSIQIPKPDTAK